MDEFVHVRTLVGIILGALALTYVLDLIDTNLKGASYLAFLGIEYYTSHRLSSILDLSCLLFARVKYV